MKISNHPQIPEIERFATDSLIVMSRFSRYVQLEITVEHRLNGEKVKDMPDKAVVLYAKEEYVDQYGNYEEDSTVIQEYYSQIAANPELAATLPDPRIREFDFIYLLKNSETNFNNFINFVIQRADQKGRFN